MAKKYRVSLDRIELRSQIALLFFFFFFLIPVFFVFKNFFNEFDLALFQTYQSSILFTIKQTVWSVMGSLLLAISLFLVLKNKIHAHPALLIPFSLPTLVTAYAFLFFYPTLGGRVFEFEAIVACHIFLNAPFLLFVLLDLERKKNEEEIFVRQSLGQNKILAWLHTAFFSKKTEIFYAGFIVFSLCFSSFIIVLMLGGGAPKETLEVKLYSTLVYGIPKFQHVSFLCVVQILILLPFWIWLERRRRTFPVISKEKDPMKPSWLLMIIFLVLLFSPYFVLFFDQIIEGAIRIPAYSNSILWKSVIQSIFLSSMVSMSSTFLAYFLFSSTYPFLKSFALLPYVFPPLVLGVSLWFSYPFLSRSGVGQMVGLFLSQTVLLVPFLIRFFSVLENKSISELRMIAKSMGARKLACWTKIEWPLIRTTMFLSMMISFVGSLGEAGLSHLFSHPEFVPLSKLISQKASQYQFGEANFLIFILFVLGILAWFSYFIWSREKKLASS